MKTDSAKAPERIEVKGSGLASERRGLMLFEKYNAKGRGPNAPEYCDPERISVEAGKIEITETSGDVTEIPVGSVDQVAVSSSLSHSRLTLRTSDGKERLIGVLYEVDAKRIRDAVHVEARRVTSALGRRLLRLDGQRSQLFEGSRYVRHAETCAFHTELKSVLDEGRRLVQEHLSIEEREALNRLAPYEFIEKLDAARERANSAYIRAQVPTVRRASLPNPVSEEQAEAIATDEDVTLALAGAGTGKTGVIVGKAAHLVRNEAVLTSEILVLTYNKDAAKNIRDRLRDDLTEVAVNTFHAFGSGVIADVEGRKPTISTLAEDEVTLVEAVEDTIREMLQDPAQSRPLVDFIASFLTPYRPAHDFETLAEYKAYVYNVDRLTLKGHHVKSIEELEIANFLTMQGIEYEYERRYQEQLATREFSQYRPDFYLPEHDIYIEHFALDERERPPPGWPNYVKGVKWKRDTHRKYSTNLIETFSWQRKKGELLETLQARLEREGVEFRPVPVEELVKKLAERPQRISRLAGLLKTFLDHVKTSGLTYELLCNRVRGDRRRSELFLEVFRLVNERYEQLLLEEGALDFHDLINRAAGYIREGRWESPYRYVLVDEFQDISAGRMALLQALRQENKAYFLVGDDWQSIYRFAGSDVGLVRNCGEWLGHVKERSLSQTFRFGKGIGDPSTDFVRRNPEQTQRELLPRPKNGSADEGITVVADGDPRRAIEEIASRAGGKDLPVLVLGRYNDSEKELPQELHRRFIFRTVHKAKGLQAEFAVVLGLKDERKGFPSQIEDDPLLELVLPSKDEGAYPFAEERRLFYVAMTRAKRGVYLVTDPKRPSAFVRELLQNFPDLRQLGEFPPPDPPCPRCHSGQLILSQSSKNLRCSNDPYCQHLAPRCRVCAAGYTVVRDQSTSACTNPVCDHAPKVCPMCRVGVLERKPSRHGPFWGCSEYRSLPPCRYTRDDRETAKITGSIARP